MPGFGTLIGAFQGAWFVLLRVPSFVATLTGLLIWLGVPDPPPLNWSTLKYVFGRRRRTTMLKKRHKPEEVVAKLRQVDVLTSQGKSVADAIRTIGVTEVTYYRWRQEFGGLKSDQVKRPSNQNARDPRHRTRRECVPGHRSFRVLLHTRQ
jgi:putative transposase